MIHTTRAHFSRTGELLRGSADDDKDEEEGGEDDDSEVPQFGALLSVSGDESSSSRNPRERALLDAVAALGRSVDASHTRLAHALHRASVLDATRTRASGACARRECASDVRAACDALCADCGDLRGRRADLAFFADANASVAAELADACGAAAAPVADAKRSLAAAESLLCERIDWLLAGLPPLKHQKH